jgi:NADH-quinone oxidoreductase subunit B
MAVEQKTDTAYRGEKYMQKFTGGEVIMTKAEDLLNWAKGSSIWPLTFGLSCCAIEMMATGASRFDIDRLGSGVFRASPRQCDVMIVAGTICVKMGECMKKLYAQMPDPKYVIAMGNCAIGGGIFYHDTYSVVQGTEQLGIPVDVHVVGCPPRPEGLLNGILMLKQKIQERGKPTINLPEKIVVPENTQGLMKEQIQKATENINGPAQPPAQNPTPPEKPTA